MIYAEFPVERITAEDVFPYDVIIDNDNIYVVLHRFDIGGRCYLTYKCGVFIETLSYGYDEKILRIGEYAEAIIREAD